MRALVIGGSGQVGAALERTLVGRGHTAVATHHRMSRPGTVQLDVRDEAATSRVLTDVAPDVVFCPAGLTFVDYCEDHADEAFQANCEAPARAAKLAAKRGAAFVFFSTEYVFDGRDGPYGEDDPVTPLSVYGHSKLDGERAVMAANPRALVVRTTVVYGPEPQGKNFIYQLRRRIASGETVKVPADQRSSPTFNVDLANATVELVERACGGVVHVAGPSVIDRYTFARLACDVFDLDVGLVVPVTTADLRQRAARPLNAGLRIERVKRQITTPLRDPAAGLTAMRALLEGRAVDTTRGHR
jgi:dTDP-4-dehydrorhamnose reductase